MFRAHVAGLVVLAMVAFAGCGERDTGRASTAVTDRVAEAQRTFQQRRDELAGKLESVLGKLHATVPEAVRSAPQLTVDGRADAQTIDEFLDSVLLNIDEYWSQTFREAGLPEPSVRFVAVPPGEQLATDCGTTADDQAAFYCPADDTIYKAQVFASELYDGMVNGLPGQSAGYGSAAGDFAVAYVLAHEYAHNLQYELGIFSNPVTPKARPYELHADCWSGTWGNSTYQQGRLEDGDLEEALNAALAVGDFDFGNAQHHGTPEERRDALLSGYRTGDPNTCSTYLPPATGT